MRKFTFNSYDFTLDNSKLEQVIDLDGLHEVTIAIKKGDASDIASVQIQRDGTTAYDDITPYPKWKLGRGELVLSAFGANQVIGGKLLIRRTSGSPIAFAVFVKWRQ